MPTEQQAAEMWCPYSRVLSAATGFTQPASQVAGFNRAMVSRETVTQERGIHTVRETVDVPAGATCIGSRCMAWRWDHVEGDHGYRSHRMLRAGPDRDCPDCAGTGVQPAAEGHGEPCDRCEGDGRLSDWQPVGFCGLAGRPD